MDMGPVGAKVLRATEGTWVSDGGALVLCGICWLTWRKNCPGRGQLRGAPVRGGKSSRYPAVGTAVFGVGAAVFGCLGDEQLDPGLRQGCSDLGGGSLLRYQAVRDR